MSDDQHPPAFFAYLRTVLITVVNGKLIHRPILMSMHKPGLDNVQTGLTKTRRFRPNIVPAQLDHWTGWFCLCYEFVLTTKINFQIEFLNPKE